MLLSSKSALLLAACMLTSAVATAAPRSPVWVIEGQKNTLYLLGSVHVLRESDYPLPKAIDVAYRDAEVVYMEIDLDDMPAGEALQFTLANASLPAGRTLRDVLGLADFTAADMKANSIGVDLAMFAQFEPWVAALAVVQAQISHLGLEADHGVEQYVLRHALKDKKEIRGLETLSDQLGVLDGLPLDRQGKFLLMSLEESNEMPEQLDGMIGAWRRGDAATLANVLGEEFGDFPDLYQSLIVARNRNWSEQIRALLDDEQDYLIVVGALHLVGEHSVLEMLSEHDIVARQQ
jgi:uncharacterized protein